MASIDTELDDIQGNILRAYGFPFARYEVIRIADRAGARRLLSGVIEQKLVTTATSWDPQSKPGATLNVFFSWTGLQAIGLPQASLDSFPPEFREGMAARAALLGDTGASHPDIWEVGNDPDKNHVFFAVYGRTLADRDRLLEQLRRELAVVGDAVEVTHRLDAAMLANRREHFGFADGIGQPSIEGSGAPVYPGEGTLRADGTWAPLAPGEFVLGWPGETGFAIPIPQPDALGRNGSFMVYRKLEQHVTAFRAFLSTQAERLYGEASGQAIERLASKLVGRWRSGCPLSLAPDLDDPTLATDWDRNNDFGYAADLAGVACPYGAHIRRMNPRDGRAGDALVRTHRIVRRGLPYGRWLEPGEAETEQRGVAFMSINASISYQFEFLQTEWINSGEFAELSKNDVDPFAGVRRDGTRFRIPNSKGPPKNIFDLPEFVTTRGGGYYFIPSITALRFIAGQVA
ncbi:MAG: Dyp-type peroxidase [Vicinamibacterales bacterium]